MNHLGHWTSPFVGFSQPPPGPSFFAVIFAPPIVQTDAVTYNPRSSTLFVAHECVYVCLINLHAEISSLTYNGSSSRVFLPTIVCVGGKERILTVV